jgi:DNA-3-methyladenine glycosylase
MNLNWLDGDTLASARRLLGWRLLCDTPEGRCSGIIVETEAYTADDPACHASRGSTPRNRAMFGPSGHAYVYHIHRWFCVNVVTRPPGIGEAVLIRALEPEQGLDLMSERRKTSQSLLLCAGPGRLCSALGIGMMHNEMDLSTGQLRLEPGRTVVDEDIAATARIGISQAVDRPWRFCVRDSPFLSRRLPAVNNAA